MRANAPLSYYTEQAGPGRRPWIVTAVAVVGIVLSVLALSLTGTRLPVVSMRPRGFDMSPAFHTTLLAASVIRTLAGVLMVVACGGVLSMRDGARRLFVGVAYAWVALGVIAVVTLGDGYLTVNNAAPDLTTPAPVAVAIAITLLVDVAYPIAGMLVLRRGGVVERFGRPFPRAMTPPAFARRFAIVAAVVAGVGLADSLLEFGAALLERPGGSRCR